MTVNCTVNVTNLLFSLIFRKFVQCLSVLWTKFFKYMPILTYIANIILDFEMPDTGYTAGYTA